jgi:hypothetical protein
MNCARCGFEVESSGAAFCSHCGFRLPINAGSSGGRGGETTSRGHLDSAEEGLLAAAHLAYALRSGWTPPAITAPIALYAGEAVYGSTGFHLFNYSGANVSYRRGFVAGFGSPLALAATIGGSLLYNSVQKSKAQAQARVQWRLVNEGVAHLTDRRFALQGRLRWHDIFYSSVKATECLDDGIVIMLDGQEPLKLSTPWPQYYFVLFNWLGYRSIPDVQLPDRLRERFRRERLSDGLTVQVVER